MQSVLKLIQDLPIKIGFFNSVWQCFCKKLYHLKKVGASLLSVLENKVLNHTISCKVCWITPVLKYTYAKYYRYHLFLCFLCHNWSVLMPKSSIGSCEISPLRLMKWMLDDSKRNKNFGNIKRSFHESQMWYFAGANWWFGHWKWSII